MSHYTVLGATGLIGRNLVESLQAQGHTVFAPSRREWAEVLTQPLGHVIYAIGLTADYRTQPYQTVEAHVTRLNEVIHQGHYESLVYLSSTRVYQYALGTSEDAFVPVQPKVPGDLYNLSKLLGESICMNAPHPNTVVARLSNVLAPQGHPENFINSLILDAQSRGHVHFQTSPQSQKDYIALADVVALLPQLHQSPHRIVNLASGVNTSHQEVADSLERHLRCRISWEPDAPTWTFPPIDVSKLAESFDFSPTPFAVTINAMLSQFVLEGATP